MHQIPERLNAGNAFPAFSHLTYPRWGSACPHGNGFPTRKRPHSPRGTANTKHSNTFTAVAYGSRHGLLRRNRPYPLADTPPTVESENPTTVVIIGSFLSSPHLPLLCHNHASHGVRRETHFRKRRAAAGIRVGCYCPLDKHDLGGSFWQGNYAAESTRH